ncbi:Short chain dehydrogenase-like protein 69 [Elsinoe fawcettii]|nr:Short chain dehydrogenase-like protein 69 [Elsinoe fawcettii]
MPGFSYLPRFFVSQWFYHPAVPTASFAGKTIIVTGANQGLGLEAAQHVVRLGAAKVILAVRSPAKGEQAKRLIEQATGVKDVVEVWDLDLSSYKSVRTFAHRADTSLDRIDVLLENAGMSTTTYTKAENNEATITTNVISTMLLARLLLPKLEQTAQRFNTTPHLTIVSSEVHYFSNLAERKLPGSIFGNLADKKTFGSDRYMTSKLALVMAIRQWVEEVNSIKKEKNKPTVIINHINPGLCHSSLLRDVGWIQFVAKAIFGARTTEVGSRTLVDATVQDERSHGMYLSDCKVAPVSSFVTSAEGRKTAERVWDELKEILRDAERA